ncbi:MAG: penicillin-binding protein activator LpoB [Cytophagaceae bacterium]|nr:penicillin-binding protein activator LpoB [Cytophagaceae bacterium]MDW8457252.1 penicillin-binding protein activator LpoB [Cytophagaceae bacterium]
MKTPFFVPTVLALVIFTFIGCTRKTVTRVNPDRQIDLSGRWNDTDSRLVAEEMAKDMFGRPWLNNFQNSKGKKPVMIVGIITNKSHEHIEPETFIKDLERECINTSLVRVVQNSELREKMRQERADQQQFASPETQKKWGRELGADFMLFGTINSIVDQEGRKKVIFYQVNLELADMETNELVWIGEKKIKKYVVN